MKRGEEYITIPQAARLIGIGRGAMYRYTMRGLLPVLRTPTGTMRVRVADVEALVKTPLDQGTRKRSKGEQISS